MNIECKSFHGNGYLMSPNVDALHKLRFNEKGCTHFLLFSYPVNHTLNINETNIGEVLSRIENLLGGEKIYIKELDASVQCINKQIYLTNGSAIQLDVVASRYTILGSAHSREQDTLYIYWPKSIEAANFALSVEMKYQVRRHTVESGSIFGIKLGGVAGHIFKPKMEETDFCEVLINNAPDYVDGSITYTVGDNPYKYPITKAMLGKWILIKSPRGLRLPEFKACDSITLVKIESNNQV